MKPRILLNDKNLTRTDTDILSLIISLAIRNNYCYATNKYLSDYINVSERTICYSIKKFKELNYIFIERVDGKRRIYINKDVIPMTRVSAKSCTVGVQRVAVSKRKGLHNEGATDCTHNIYNKYKKEYKKYKIKKFKQNNKIPNWMDNKNLCNADYMTDEEEIKFRKELFK